MQCCTLQAQYIVSALQTLQCTAHPIYSRCNAVHCNCNIFRVHCSALLIQYTQRVSNAVECQLSNIYRRCNAVHHTLQEQCTYCECIAVRSTCTYLAGASCTHEICHHNILRVHCSALLRQYVLAAMLYTITTSALQCTAHPIYIAGAMLCTGICNHDILRVHCSALWIQFRTGAML